MSKDSERAAAEWLQLLLRVQVNMMHCVRLFGFAELKACALYLMLLNYSMTVNESLCSFTQCNHRLKNTFIDSKKYKNSMTLIVSSEFRSYKISMRAMGF